MNGAVPKLELRGVRKAFGAATALAGVDLLSGPARSTRWSGRMVPGRARC